MLAAVIILSVLLVTTVIIAIGSHRHNQALRVDLTGARLGRAEDRTSVV